jgi:hypothetical protein
MKYNPQLIALQDQVAAWALVEPSERRVIMVASVEDPRADDAVLLIVGKWSPRLAAAALAPLVAQFAKGEKSDPVMAAVAEVLAAYGSKTCELNIKYNRRWPVSGADPEAAP